jgi:predicted nucleic acid-binding protein
VTAEGPLVVDANVAIKWFVPEALSDRAAFLLRQRRLLLAPLILPAEFGNVMRKKLRTGEIQPDDAAAAIGGVLALVDLRPISDLLRAAWDITVHHNRSFYDALYVALAVREGCQMVTADEKLVNGMGALFRDRFLLLDEVLGGPV